MPTPPIRPTAASGNASTGTYAIETRTEIWAELSFRAPLLDFDAISQALGLVPTKTWRRGDLAYRRGSDKRWTDDGWEWSTDRSVSLDLPEHLQQVMGTIRPHRDAVLNLVRSGASGCLQGVALVRDEDYPALVFDNELLREVSDFGLYLAIDQIAAPAG